MPVVLYLLALLATIISSAAGIALLAAICAAVAVSIAFRHELAQIRLPRIQHWRTDP
jgi:hypothetical protein